jgi:uncharacterized protein (DUF1015 family)
VPRFDPFPALRYDPARFAPDDVTAPPYDVLSAEDRAELVARDPHNAVLIDLPTEADGPDRYAEAGHRLHRWLAEGVLVPDAQPTFTAYRMTAPDHAGRPVSTLGVLGALTLSRPDQGEILPHEHTTEKAKSDRLDLLRGTRANLSAIWGLSLAKGLTDLLGVDAIEPDQAWADADGVTHEVWRIDDADRLTAITAAVASQPVVIADGHHRYATSLAYRDERIQAEGDPGDAAATLCYVVELSEEQLTVRPIHRLVTEADVSDLAVVLAEHPGLSMGGSVTASDVADGTVLDEMERQGAMAVVRPDGTATLLPVDPDAFGDDVDDLDSTRLIAALGAVGPHQLSYQHGTDRVQSAVTSGEAQWGVLIRPVTVAQIEQNAHTGNRMPPKSTFFHPKPKTGIVFRRL